MTLTPPIHHVPMGSRRRQPVPRTPGPITVLKTVIEKTDTVMRRYGREGRECYVWWGGYFLPDGTAIVVSAIYPDVPTSFGRIHLRRPALSALHAALRDLDLVLIVELHTHPPGAGGQNDVDAANPAATYPGFVSVVVPDFAHPRFADLRCTYVYEYVGEHSWKTLTRAEIEGRFVVDASSPHPEEPALIAVKPQSK